MTYLILDGVILFILIVYTLKGAKNGLFRSVAEFLKQIISFGGAYIGAKMIAPVVSEKLFLPFAKRFILDRVSEVAIAEEAFEDLNLFFASIGDKLKGLFAEIGITGPESLGTGENPITVLVDKLGGDLAYSLAFLLAFFLVFIALSIVCAMVISGLDFVLDITLLSPLNRLAGAALGFASSAILVSLLLWTAFSAGDSFFSQNEAFSKENLESSYLTKAVLEHKPPIFDQIFTFRKTK